MFAKKSEGKKDRDKAEENNRRPGSSEAEVEDDDGLVQSKKVKGLGNGAYWVTNESGGALYVLFGQKIVRVSVGGRDGLPTKLQSSKTIARSVLARL